ncbi:ferrous iron transport protein B [Lebetimonas natsushimae]|uniref:Ferrous iron transport protein B n=1 Tax=Lebetimonas natsushimae TaxID=1936991 RepID=A0A292YB70_9BACT|nr:ferrous iron transport protein B [Lebetimonas natsushimae]GAX86776.1 ferrous iron transport protein B [Lebetimonas natsushimae]
MITIAFVGNPNTGKTALINAIAGTDLEVGNWPGVTVEKKEVTFNYGNETLHLIDLPGTYTLSPYTMEEKITRDVICSSDIDGIINVVDTTDIRRNLYLTLELIDLQKPIVISLNMFDEFTKRGYSLDIAKLQNILGIVCVPTIATIKLGVKEVINKSVEAVKNNHIPKIMPYQEHIEKEIDFLIKKMENIDCRLKRFLAIKLLENDEFAIKRIEEKAPFILEDVKNARERLKKHFGMSVKEFIIRDRYQRIDKILNKVMQKPLIDKVLLSDKIDGIVLHKWLGLPVFFTIMFLMFKITFDGSSPFVEWMGGFFENFVSPHLRAAMTNLPEWLSSFIVDGMVSGVGLVLSFLPLLFFLYFFMAVLEESGYMARVSFLLDKLASKLGIKGNAFISLIIGFGCNVPAVYSTRTMSSFRERIITTLMIPFMSCSARLPVYALFAGLFFFSYQSVIIFSFYIIGIAVAFITAFLANKIIPKTYTKPFFLELPTYHIPTLRGIWILMWPKLKDFIVKAGTVIVAASVILWVVINLPPNSTPKSSYLAEMSKKITPVFKPLGFGGHWEPVAALIPGTLAKEVIIGSLGTIYGVESDKKPVAKNGILKDFIIQMKSLYNAFAESVRNLFTVKIKTLEIEKQPSELQQKIKSQFTSLGAFSYLVFVLLYIPCVSTMAAIKNEFGWKLMIFETVFLPIVAYFVSFVIYNFLRFI